MNKEEFLKAFAELSAEDQNAVRAELTGKGASEETEAAGGPMAMCHEMMAKMTAGKDPKAMCEEMMRNMAGKCG